MLTIDWIVLAVLAASAVLGMLFGFGKLLKFFTGGIVGFIISIFVVYFFTGIVSGWGFVKELMERLHTVMETLLEDISFRADEYAGQDFTIVANYVKDKLASLYKDLNLDKYIL